MRTTLLSPKGENLRPPVAKESLRLILPSITPCRVYRHTRHTVLQARLYTSLLLNTACSLLSRLQKMRYRLSHHYTYVRTQLANFSLKCT